MSVVAITMPRWGLTMEEGLLTAWLVPLGAPMTAGTDVVEVESSKLAGVVEATQDGVLRRQVASVGQTLPVGALLGVIASADVSDADIDAFADGFVPVDADADEDAAAGPQTIVTDAGELSFVRAGGGEPLLFLHGFGGDAGSWGFLQGALAGEFDTIALDLPGHGRSTRDVADTGLAGQAAAVAGFLEELALEAVHVVGHSMGGGIALALAASRPELVKSLILLAPVGLGILPDPDFLSAFCRAEKRRDVMQVLKRLFADDMLATAALAEEVLKYKRLDGVRDVLERFAASLGTGSEAEPAAVLGALSMPVTVLWGDADRIVPFAAGRVPSAVLLPGIGHMPQVEAPERVLAEIRRTAASA